ncbi:MAG: carboxypeptidase-like regulatory domain-containing protein [Alistipes sp.]|nr:carboxypeptidase-like regulatory domain-containing protein [Alistipes sp.]
MKKIVFMISFTLAALCAQAQHRVTGKVVDVNGNPMTGTIVQEQHSSRGVVTDLNGRYELTTAPDATLCFAYIGYETQRVQVASKAVIDVTLYASSEADSEKTLYVVDGKPMAKADVDQLPAESIQNMNVMRGVESVVLITTQPEAAGRGSSSELTTIRIDKGDSGKITINKELAGKMVYVRTSESPAVVKALNLVKHPDGKIEVLENINDIQPEKIQSVAVYKNAEKTEQFKQYGDTSNGVIYIELKE